MRRILIFLILGVAVTSCTMLPLKDNNYYSRKEKKMIEDTANAAQLGFGFDSQLDINYFFYKQSKEPLENPLPQRRGAGRPGGTVESAQSAAEEMMTEKGDDTSDQLKKHVDAYAKAMSDHSDTDQYALYQKVFYLHSMISYMYHYYERTKNWRLYNVMRLQLYEPTDYYMTVCDEYFKTNKPLLFARLNSHRDTIKKEAIMFVQKKYTIVDEYQ